MNSNGRKNELIRRGLSLIITAVLMMGYLLQGGGVMIKAHAYPLNEKIFVEEKEVYWDVSSGKQKLTGGESRVTKVELNNIEVTHGNSAAAVTGNFVSGFKLPWSGGKELGDYYGSASERSLTITPAPGYYVTKVTVACSAGLYPGTSVSMPSSPYNCGTWESGNAYTTEFSIAAGGETTVSIPKEAFGHMSNEGTETNGKKTVYFILIELKPLPSPVYVEYQYGNIVNYITDNVDKNVFTGSSATWLTANGNNKYGTGSMQTANTQHMHAYASGLSDSDKAAAAAAWRHYAGGITPEAAAAALDAGYTFAGWKATYYTQISVSDTDSGTNKYTYSFDNNSVYGTADYGAGNQVPLMTHVKLVAQWEKVKTGNIQITKTVQGGIVDANKAFTFTAKLFDSATNSQLAFPSTVAFSGTNMEDLGKTGKDWSFTLKDGGTALFAYLPAGTYLEVSEAADDNYITEINPSNGRQSVEAGKTKTIAFINTLKTGNVEVTKTVQGGIVDTNKAFTFTAKLFNSTTNEQIEFPSDVALSGTKMEDLGKTGKDWSFTLKDGGTALFEKLPAGTYLVVSEADDDNYTTEINPSNGEQSVEVDKTKTIAFTNTLKTGNVEVTKTVQGGIVDTNKAFTFTAKLFNSTTNEQIEFPGDVALSGTKMEDLGKTSKDWSFTLKDGGTALFEKLPIGTYLMVTETPDEYYTTQVDPNNGQQLVEAGKTKTIAFTNTLKTVDVMINKVVTGNMGDTAKEFDFTVTMVDHNNQAIGFVEIPDGADYDETKMSLSFKLSHDGDPITLEAIPVGAILTISEIRDGYMASATVNGERVDVTTDNLVAVVTHKILDDVKDVIVVTNDKTVTIDTGIVLDSLPYVLILAGVIVVGVILFLRKRKIED